MAPARRRRRRSRFTRRRSPSTASRRARKLRIDEWGPRRPGSSFSHAAPLTSRLRPPNLSAGPGDGGSLLSLLSAALAQSAPTQLLRVRDGVGGLVGADARRLEHAWQRLEARLGEPHLAALVAELARAADRVAVDV